MDDKVEKIATFHSHYAAMLFKKKLGQDCYLAPVPRSLSSSCGTAAFFSGEVDQSLLNEDLEAIYHIKDGKYEKIYGD